MNNNYSIIGLLVGSLALFGSIAGSSSHPFAKQTLSTESSVSSAEVSVASAAAALRVESETEKPVFIFDKVNDITLYDDPAVVEEKAGHPVSITTDPLFEEMAVYGYHDMIVAFSYGMVAYVEVFPGAGSVKIDETTLSLTVEDLKEAFGEPDYIAEDGIVFQRGESLIKIFLEEGTENIISISFYPLSGT